MIMKGALVSSSTMVNYGKCCLNAKYGCVKTIIAKDFSLRTMLLLQWQTGEIIEW